MHLLSVAGLACSLAGAGSPASAAPNRPKTTKATKADARSRAPRASIESNERPARARSPAPTPAPAAAPARVTPALDPAPAKPGGAVVKTEELRSGEKTYTFGAQEVEGRLKSPQILYFLRRVRAEFDPAPLGHRSFLLELSDTRRHRAFE